MFLGIDLGTSGVKVLLLDRNQKVLMSASSGLTVQQPKALWREQNPIKWRQACEESIQEVLKNATEIGLDVKKIEAIGISGQMHGATF